MYFYWWASKRLSVKCCQIDFFQSLSEELFSAKLFLTSALYEPILGLLSDDEIFLDIDPTKTVIRFANLFSFSVDTWHGRDRLKGFQSRLKSSRG